MANSDGYEETRSVDLVVFDKQIPAANLLARRASGVTNLPTGKDLYPLWNGRLKAELQQSPKTVAGVTSGEAAFCLAEVAKDYGYELIQSEVLKARRHFDPTVVTKSQLSVFELNRPLPVAWVMAPSGVTFRSAPAFV
ncbi:MAG: hypothetical protein AAF996_02975 [Pseudomonadota bacterium]